MSWLENKTGPPAKTLATVEEAVEFVKPLGVAVIGFFEDETSEAAKAFLLAAGESSFLNSRYMSVKCGTEDTRVWPTLEFGTQ